MHTFAICYWKVCRFWFNTMSKKRPLHLPRGKLANRNPTSSSHRSTHQGVPELNFSAPLLLRNLQLSKYHFHSSSSSAKTLVMLFLLSPCICHATVEMEPRPTTSHQVHTTSLVQAISALGLTLHRAASPLLQPWSHRSLFSTSSRKDFFQWTSH